MADSTSGNKGARSAGSGQATSMADLMAKYQPTFTTLKKGETVKGTITKLEKNEMLLDIQAKGEALVIEKDPRLLRNLLNTLSVGDVVEATVISPESESGQPIVTLRPFIENQTWKKVEEMKKNNDQVEITITESTKGGYVVVSDEGFSGFLPNSHISASIAKDLSVGKKTKATVADFERENRKVIFSQKSTQSPEEFEKAVSSLKVGSKVVVTVANATNFGYFVTVPVGAGHIVDGLVHISELSWDRVDDTQSMFAVGEQIETVVLGIDKDGRRIDLSIKRLSADPFVSLKESFPLEKKVSGTVTEIKDGNVTVDLGEGIEGLIRKEKVPPTLRFEVGSTVNATVSAHDQRRRRIELVPVLLEKPIGYR